MKVTLLLTEGKATSVEVSAVNKALLQGMVDNVFSYYTDEDVLFLWRELKSLATIGLHDKHSKLMIAFLQLSELFSKIVGEHFEYDCYALKFDCGDKSFVLSAGSGVKTFGFDPSTTDWDWSAGELGCLEPALPEFIKRYDVE